MRKLPKSYAINGITPSGTEFTMFTQLAPIDKGEYYLVEEINKKEIIRLNKGEGIYDP